jgi:hypothetical protein
VWPAQGLASVNDRLQLYANQHSGEVTFLDCGAIFFAGPDRLSDELLPDALHPSAAGIGIAAQCSLTALRGRVMNSCHAVNHRTVCRCSIIWALQIGNISRMCFHETGATLFSECISKAISQST